MKIPTGSLEILVDRVGGKWTQCSVTTISDESVLLASQILLEGGVVVIPTDTVYGISVDARNKEAVKKISLVKTSSLSKAHLVLVSDTIMLEQFAYMTDLAWKLLNNFTNKPLTLILRPRGSQLSAVQSMTGTVGFRIPQFDFCRKLLDAFKAPLVSTSANRSGDVCCYNVSNVVKQVGIEHISLIVDGGELSSSGPSTVVDATGDKAVIVRRGAVSQEELVRYVI